MHWIFFIIQMVRPVHCTIHRRNYPQLISSFHTSQNLQDSGQLLEHCLGSACTPNFNIFGAFEIFRTSHVTNIWQYQVSQLKISLTRLLEIWYYHCLTNKSVYNQCFKFIIIQILNMTCPKLFKHADYIMYLLCFVEKSINLCPQLGSKISILKV